MAFYTFRTPTVQEGLEQWQSDPLLRRLHLDQGISILEGPPGVYRAARFPTQDEVAASLPAFYQGGHQYVVDSATRAALIAANIGVTAANFTIIQEDGVAITSINGYTGPVVVLTIADIGANKKIDVTSQYVTSGNITLPNTSASWQAVPGLEIQVAASVGDWVELTPSFMFQQVGVGYLDLAVIKGTALVRYSSTGGPSTAAANEGDPALYPNSGFVKSGTSFGFTVTSSDLDSGNVRFVVATRCDGAGSVIYASSNYPFRWTAKNYGPVA